MILRYRGCPDSAGSQRHYELPHLVVGREYEVAEIFEMEGHLMARVPGTARWPAPGEPTFGTHPEWFEPIDEPIPIDSCGYEHNVYLCDFLGVLLDDARHIQIVERLCTIDRLEHASPQALEASCVCEARDLSASARAVVTECLWGDQPVQFGVVREALGLSTAVGEDVPSVRVPFAYVGCPGDAMFRRDLRHDQYKDWLQRILSALGIEVIAPRILQCSYWRGKGNPRLINPRSRERYLYGIDDGPREHDNTVNEVRS